MTNHEDISVAEPSGQNCHQFDFGSAFGKVRILVPSMSSPVSDMLFWWDGPVSFIASSEDGRLCVATKTGEPDEESETFAVVGIDEATAEAMRKSDDLLLVNQMILDRVEAGADARHLTVRWAAGERILVSEEVLTPRAAEAIFTLAAPPTDSKPT